MMKRLITLICIFSSTQLTAQTGIGTTTPNAAAKLDVSSTEKGLLIPRMTKSQREAITLSAAANGLLVYQTDDLAGFYVNTSTTTTVAWTRVNTDWTRNSNNINYSLGNVGIGTVTPSEKLEVNGSVKASSFIGGETPIYLSTNKATSQSIPFSDVTIITNWNGTSWINNFPSAWNSTTGAWTCPRAGVYEFFFSAMLAPHAASGIGNEFAVILYLNGSLQSIGNFWAQTTSTTRTPHAITNLIMSLNVGDVVTTRIYQNLNGNAINTQEGRLYFQVKQLPSRINRE